MTRLPTPSDRTVVKEGRDTLQSGAQIDVLLDTGPIVLSIPPIPTQRQQLFQLMDSWTNTIASPSQRTVGPKGGKFCICGPGQENVPLPNDVQRIISPTRNIVLIGRVQVFGDQDIQNANDIYQNVSLNPLSKYYGTNMDIIKNINKPCTLDQDQLVSSQTPPQIVKNMNAQQFFGEFTELMNFGNMPSPNDTSMNKILYSLGIVPGKKQNWKKLTLLQKFKQIMSVKLGKIDLIEDQLKLTKNMQNGWQDEPDDIGNFGTDQSTRVGIALQALFANPREDAVYYTAKTQFNGNKQLAGGASQTITLDKAPPVAAFWSITLQDINGQLLSNPSNKYSVSSWENPHINNDGTITIFIQTLMPNNLKTNWIPSPTSSDKIFQLFFRAQSPDKEILERKWKINPVIKQKSATK